jgi:PII-like signaling protein
MRLADLKTKGKGRLIRIFIGENERVRGRPLHEVIVLKAKELGLAGATVLKGSEGFGAHSRVEGKRPLKLSVDATLVIEIIDHPDRIAKAVPALESLVTQGLIVIEDVEVLKYVTR